MKEEGFVVFWGVREERKYSWMLMIKNNYFFFCKFLEFISVFFIGVVFYN